ncbi:MAG: hypothetical protein GY719_28990 [bacterium]|nr:hypothetical protein [bacterium]
MPVEDPELSAVEEGRELERILALRVSPGEARPVHAGGAAGARRWWLRHREQVELGLLPGPNAAYCGVGARLGARVAPVGMAWRLSLETDPAVTLHQADGSHQNARGMYLTGLVFYRALYGGDPVGLPHDLSSNVVVTEAEAAYLQTIARDAPECPAEVFADGFESGDTSAWGLPSGIAAAFGQLAGAPGHAVRSARPWPAAAS